MAQSWSDSFNRTASSWSNSTTYALGALVAPAGATFPIYISKQSGNQGHALPTTSTYEDAWWKVYLGSGWTEPTGLKGFQIDNSRAAASASGRASIRDTDCDTDTQYAECLANAAAGPMVRGSASADSGYFAYIVGDLVDEQGDDGEGGTFPLYSGVTIERVVSGTRTIIRNGATGGYTDRIGTGDTLKIGANGSSIKVYKNGAQLAGTITDSNLSGASYRRVGLRSIAAAAVDNWAGGDDSAGSQTYTEDRAEAATGPTDVTDVHHVHLVTETLSDAAKTADQAVAAGPRPTFVAAGTIATGTGSVSPGLPAGAVAGDLLVALCNEPISTPSGWTRIPGVNIWAHYRVMTGSGDAPTFTGSGAMGALILAFRDADPSRIVTALTADFVQSPQASVTSYYDRALAVALYNAKAVGADPTISSSGLSLLSNQTATLSGSTFRMGAWAKTLSAPGSTGSLAWTPVNTNSLFAWLVLTPVGPMHAEASDIAAPGDEAYVVPHETHPAEDVADTVKASESVLHVSEPYVVDVSDMVRGFGKITIPVPAKAQPGDLALLMGICPDGPTDYRPATSGANAWQPAATWNWVKVIGPNEPAFEIYAQTGSSPAPGSSPLFPDASIGAAVAIFRNVDTNTLPTVINGYALPEDGGYAAGSVPPAQSPQFRNPSAAAPVNGPLGPNGFTAPIDKCIVVASFQSEATDSYPDQVAFSARGAPNFDWMGSSGPQTSRLVSTSYTWRHGFLTLPLPRAGDVSGYLTWKTTGQGGGWDTARGAPYPGPAAWFSMVLLKPGAFKEDVGDIAKSSDEVKAQASEVLSDAAKSGEATSSQVRATETAAEVAKPGDFAGATALGRETPFDRSTAGDAVASQVTATEARADAATARESSSAGVVATESQADAAKTGDQVFAGSVVEASSGASARDAVDSSFTGDETRSVAAQSGEAEADQLSAVEARADTAKPGEAASHTVAASDAPDDAGATGDAVSSGAVLSGATADAATSPGAVADQVSHLEAAADAARTTDATVETTSGRADEVASDAAQAGDSAHSTAVRLNDAQEAATAPGAAVSTAAMGEAGAAVAQTTDQSEDGFRGALEESAGGTAVTADTLEERLPVQTEARADMATASDLALDSVPGRFTPTVSVDVELGAYEVAVNLSTVTAAVSLTSAEASVSLT